MDGSSLHNVRDVSADERRSLEKLLGGELGENQQVFIAAYTPGKTGSAAERRIALDELRAAVTAAHASLPADVDAQALDHEIDQASDEVRYGSG